MMAAGFDVDVASTTIRVAESSLLPTITLQGSASHSSEADPTLGTFRTDQASVIGQMNAPIYDGGTAASQTRQAKELAAQSRLVLDQVRNQARTAAVGAWVANEGAKIAVTASESEVRAATVALQGVQKEAQGGQRTTVDVLNSQQDLISAKARLIGAQRDRVIASYTLLSAIGRLDVKTLGAQHAGLSAGGALPSGARRLARPAHAVGAVSCRAYAGLTPAAQRVIYPGAPSQAPEAALQIRQPQTERATSWAYAHTVPGARKTRSAPAASPGSPAAPASCR